MVDFNAKLEEDLIGTPAPLFPLEGKMTKAEVDACWNAHSTRMKGIIRERMNEYNITLWQLLEQWPKYRQECAR